MIRKPKRYLDTRFGKIAATIAMAMFSAPAALSVLSRVNGVFELSEWLQYTLRNFESATIQFWSWVLPFVPVVSDRIAGFLTLIVICAFPVFFNSTRAYFLHDKIEWVEIGQLELEDQVYATTSYMAYAVFLYAYELVIPVFLTLFIFIRFTHPSAILKKIFQNDPDSVDTEELANDLFLHVATLPLGIWYLFVRGDGLIANVIDYVPNAILGMTLALFFILNLSMRIYSPMYIFLSIVGILVLDQLQFFVPAAPR